MNRYVEAAKEGLTALQKLEVEGLLPPTLEIPGSGKQFRGSSANVWSRIFRILIGRCDADSLLWIAEGGYLVPTQKITKLCYINNGGKINEILSELEFIDQEYWHELCLRNR